MARNHRCISSIVPPYLLEAIVQYGGSQYRDYAERALKHDHSFRSTRQGGRPRGLSIQMGNDTELVQAGQAQRSIYDIHNGTSLPGEIVRREGESESKDVMANEAYEGLGATQRFYWEVYRRDSIDDRGLPLEGIVHYDIAYDNAFWDGSYMVFGDGDKTFFNRFTIALDVIGHELTHGVTEHEAGLEYKYQSGALNESISDVFGTLVKQYTLRQEVKDADWLIGAGLFTSKVNGRALRSMKEPGTAYNDPLLGKDPQPKNMESFVNTEKDNGGVHVNSGIPNHAFYQAAMALGGYAWEKAGLIWYETLRDRDLRPACNFQLFANRTLANAERLYGPSSEERNAIKSAWQVVGIHVS
jgi:Zn-dependent metalloprotease